MKMRIFLSMVMVLAMTVGAVRAGLFSNDGIVTEPIASVVTFNGGYKLALAKLHIQISYGHDDVNLFHPEVAISQNESQEIELDITTSGSEASFTIPSLDIPLPMFCQNPGFEKESLQEVHFELRLYFYNREGDFACVIATPRRMKLKKEISFAKSKKLTQKLSAIFSTIRADFENGDFSIANPKAGLCFQEYRVGNFQDMISELERIYKADMLHSQR